MTTESDNVHSHQFPSFFRSSSFSAPLFCTTNTPFAQPPPLASTVIRSQDSQQDRASEAVVVPSNLVAIILGWNSLAR
jgi:hypothetical protein